MADNRVEGPSHGSLVDMGVQQRTHSDGCTVDARIIGYQPAAGYTGPDTVSVYWGGDDNAMVETIQVFADYAAVGQAMFPYRHPSERPIAGQPPAAAAFPPPTVGYTFTVQENDGPETWTVTETGPEWSMTSSNGRSVTSRGPFLLGLHYGEPGFSLRQTYGEDASFLFPLAVGKVATSTYGGSSSAGDTWDGSLKVCTVLDAVAVDIPAGSFDTYKVQCISGGNWLAHGQGNPPYRSEMLYYAPSVGAVVVSNFQSRDGEDDTGIWLSHAGGVQS